MIKGSEHINTPSLLVFPELVKKNITEAIRMVKQPDRLWPHIKTHKTSEVISLCQEAGVQHFKCATITEAELLGKNHVKTALLAHQLVGPKVDQFLTLVLEYPDTSFKCIFDNVHSAKIIGQKAEAKMLTIGCFIDLNVGMNRTGISPEKIGELAKEISQIKGLRLEGIHAYDGHIHDADFKIRKEKADAAYNIAAAAKQSAEDITGQKLQLIISGSPAFSIHANRPDVICSPGTFIFWDANYQSFTEQQFTPAIWLATRVISTPAAGLICTDLGHKAVAAEQTLQRRVHFFDNPDLQVTGQSEEHLVLKTEQNYKVGDLLFAIPYHVCPTVALHHQVQVVEQNQLTSANWSIHRHRK